MSAEAPTSAQLANSGQRDPSYAVANLSSVSLVPYTGGRGADGPLVGVRSVGAIARGRLERFGEGWVAILGGSDPVSMIRDRQWSK